MAKALDVVERFAKALDSEDYTVAESLLESDCEYTCRGERHRGREAIIESYKGNGELAKQFDAIEYESEVLAEPDGKIRIKFMDHLTHAGRRLAFRCEQIVEVNRSDQIVRIEHIDLPGEVEALTEFKKLLVE